jgi:ABC-type transport system involved in Fe-S cluster assembly fused permease/ATPase subunit
MAPGGGGKAIARGAGMSEFLQAMLISLVSLAFTLLAVCWTLTNALTHWQIASCVAFLILYALFAIWYERQVLAPADEDRR